MKDHFVYAIRAPNKFSISDFGGALFCFELWGWGGSAYLDKYPIVYFHGRVLWPSTDLRSTPHMLTSLAARETNPVRI